MTVHEAAVRDAGRKRSAATPRESWDVLQVGVLTLVVLLIAVRFFTESLPILPRFLNAADVFMVPVLSLPVAVRMLLRPVGAIRGTWYFAGLSLLFFAWAASWILNLGDVHWLGAVLFIAGLSTPVVFYLGLINGGLQRVFVGRANRLLYWLLLLNVAIAGAQAAMTTEQGDFVLGTFGGNQNQFAFFMAYMIAHELAYWRYVGIGLPRKLVLAAVSVLFVMAGFQTLWVMLSLAVFATLIVMGGISVRTMKMVAQAAVMVPLLSLALASFASFPVFETLESVATNFGRLAKVQIARELPRLWLERPLSFLVGVGPGTFSSRGFRSIAIVPGTDSADSTNVAAALVEPFYRNELADRLVLSWYNGGENVASGSNTAGPWTSYLAVPVEIGVFGAAVVFLIYLTTLGRLVRRCRRSREGEEQALAAWAIMAMLMLLGIAVVDNYLETTRYTLLVWLAVGMHQIVRLNPPGPAVQNR